MTNIHSGSAPRAKTLTKSFCYLCAMAEQSNFVPKQNSSLTVKLKSFFYSVIAAVEAVLYYVLSLEGKPRVKPPPKTFREAKDRVLWLLINYLKETRICRVIIHIASAVKHGECSHPVTKESIWSEIGNFCESRKKATWLCVEYLKTLVCGVIVRFIKRMKSAYENKEPEYPQSEEPAILYTHEKMDKMLNCDKEFEETTNNKIIEGAAAEVSTSIANLIIGNPTVTLSVPKMRTSANLQLSTRSTHGTSSSVYNSDKVTSGSANLQTSTSLEAGSSLSNSV